MIRFAFVIVFIAVCASCSQTPRLSAVSCNAPAEAPHAKLLFFGEMHGSIESPDLVGRIACAEALHQPTALGLEIPTGEQAAIDRFLASDGSQSERRTLLSGDFWRNDKDGRASVAMASLLEFVRKLKHQSVPLTVFVFDAPSSGDRDASLAQSIREFHAKNRTLSIVALMGNVHASQIPMQLGGEQIVTTASLLKDLKPTSVLVGYGTGTVWVCMPDCGVHNVKSDWGSSKKPGFVDAAEWPGYTVSYVLPRITASPPAVDAPLN